MRSDSISWSHLKRKRKTNNGALRANPKNKKKHIVSTVFIQGSCLKLLRVTCSSCLLYFFLYLFWCGSCLGLTLVSFSITISTLSTRHGKTGGSDQVWVELIGSRVKTGHGSKRVIFKRVIRVAGQTGRGLSQVVSRVELTYISHWWYCHQLPLNTWLDTQIWSNSCSSFLKTNLGIDLFKEGRENEGGKQRMTTYNRVHNILSKEE